MKVDREQRFRLGKQFEMWAEEDKGGRAVPKESRLMVTDRLFA